MGKTQKNRWTARLVVLVALVGLYAWYTHPRTIEEFTDRVSLAEITAFYGIARSYPASAPGSAPDADIYEFRISAGTPEFDTLMSLLEGQTYSRKLSSLVFPPPTMTRINDGDFMWWLTGTTDPGPEPGLIEIASRGYLGVELRIQPPDDSRGWMCRLEKDAALEESVFAFFLTYGTLQTDGT